MSVKRSKNSDSQPEGDPDVRTSVALALDMMRLGAIAPAVPTEPRTLEEMGIRVIRNGRFYPPLLKEDESGVSE